MPACRRSARKLSLCKQAVVIKQTVIIPVPAMVDERLTKINGFQDFHVRFKALNSRQEYGGEFIRRRRERSFRRSCF
jgi:hypothetical protein